MSQTRSNPEFASMSGAVADVKRRIDEIQSQLDGGTWPEDDVDRVTRDLESLKAALKDAGGASAGQGQGKGTQKADKPAEHKPAEHKQADHPGSHAPSKAEHHEKK